MTQFQVVNPQIERAVLVGVEVRGSKPLLSLDDSLTELTMLAETAGMVTVGRVTQILNQIDPATFIGSGKVLEVLEAVEETGATCVIFDDELSPRHQRELEKHLGENIKLLDRSALILDIFAQHAKTREGALQVELAQYDYRLPRLTRQWTHLARQAGGSTGGATGGGVGVRGPGETQLEVDRREIQRKISKLKDDLEQVRRQRSQHRAQRRKTGIPIVAIVGYTNAGKSTLLNVLAKANVLAADQLFATLDPTTRRVDLPSGRQVLITDTVGFIQKLPATLVAAFRATLEEILEADLVVHVVDISHANAAAHIESVEDTLAEIDAAELPRILVWNKIDKVSEIRTPDILDENLYVDQVCISAQTGAGVDRFLAAVESALSMSMRSLRLLIPYDRGDLVSQLYDVARVTEQEYADDGVIINVEMPGYLYDKFVDYELVE